MTMLARADVLQLPLADESVDLIFTDPPYTREALPIYGRLACEAMRILRPGAFLLIMAGGMYLNQVFRMLDESGLTFFWQYHVALTGWASGIVWTRSHPKTTINVRNKPIIAYSKGDNTPRTSTISLFNGSGEDKRFHHWGQDVSSARYFIDCFSAEGDLVCDPMLGGGTTGVACQLLGRRFVGFDIDPAALKTSKNRLENSDAMVEMPLFDASVYGDG